MDKRTAIPEPQVFLTDDCRITVTTGKTQHGVFARTVIEVLDADGGLAGKVVRARFEYLLADDGDLRFRVRVRSRRGDFTTEALDALLAKAGEIIKLNPPPREPK